MTSSSNPINEPESTLSGLFHPSLIKARELKLEWLKLCKEFLPLRPTSSPWCYSRTLNSSDPEQGWKIHISATILTGGDVLRASGPYLRDLDVAFKAPATLDELRKINSGIWYGYCQVGKFITVYPRSVDEFTFVCEELHRHTRRISSGPAVPFDLKYRVRSKVYYRYGAFRYRLNGNIATANSIISPSGEHVSDRRDIPAAAPSWSSDPFEHRRKKSISKEKKTFSKRYQVFRALSQRGKGGVYEAIDIGQQPPRLCIIKEGRPNGETAWDGRDGLSRIRNETAVLSALAECASSVPRVYDSFDSGGNAYLVVEKIEGMEVQKMLDRSEEPLPIDLAMLICQELAKIISDLHALGVVWRDCKPANLLLERSGRLRAIDFEGACPIEAFDPFVWSTPIFAPPEVATGTYCIKRRSNLAEDLFALGSCLYLLIEGRLPFVNQDFTKRISMRRKIKANDKKVIWDLLSVHPDERPSAAEVCRVLDRST